MAEIRRITVFLKDGGVQSTTSIGHSIENNALKVNDKNDTAWLFPISFIKYVHISEVKYSDLAKIEED